MQRNGQNPLRIRTGKPASIWLALLAALVLHTVILLLPVTKRLHFDDSSVAQVEVQLTVFEPASLTPPELPDPVEQPPPESEAVPTAEPPPTAPQSVAEEQTESVPVEPQPPLLTATAPVADLLRPYEEINEVDQKQLAATILTRQFISEEPVTAQLFGRPLWPDSPEPQREFHYPFRPDLLTMLDRPMPELPFAYTPGLVRFAYDPGMRGDLQRFWDVITPEFGWKTRYGTEVRCIYVLVIVACGWK